MKNTFFAFLAILFTALSLSACVKNQNTDANGNTVATAPTDPSTMNDTNYQAMMQEQSARAAQANFDTHPHVGGRR